MCRSNSDWGYEFVAYPISRVLTAFEAADGRRKSGDDSVLIFDQSTHSNIFEISIPHAEKIGIVFSEQTCPQDADWLSFFQDDSISFGSVGSQKSLPGVDGVPPLIIPSSKFIAKCFDG